MSVEELAQAYANKYGYFVDVFYHLNDDDPFNLENDVKDDNTEMNENSIDMEANFLMKMV